MKHFLLLLTCFYAATLSAQWTKTEGPEGGPVNCIRRVATDIWLGANDGIYVSHNEGMSWNKSPLINSYCSDIFVQQDTIVVVYALPVYDRYILNSNIYAITSFNGGSTWSDTAFVAQSYSYPPLTDVNSMVRVRNRLFVKVGYDYHKSDNWGQNWTTLNAINGSAPTILGTDNQTLLASANVAAGNGFYYTADASDTWQLIDSAGHFGTMTLKNGALLAIFGYFDTIPHCRIGRSLNLGQTWDTVYSAEDGVYLSNFVISGNDITVSYDSLYLTSSDNGLTWHPGSNPYNNNSLTQQIDIAGGNKLGFKYPEGLVIYVPVQDTFYRTSTGFLSTYTSILFTNGNALFCGTLNGFFRSLDGGATWIDCQFVFPDVTDVVTKGDTVVAIAQGHLMRSFNNGVSWDTSSISFNAEQLELMGSRIYAALEQHMYSDDWGLSWTPYPLLDTAITNSCTTGSDQSGQIRAAGGFLFLVTNDGIIARYNPGNQQWINSGCFFSPGAGNRNALYALGNDIAMSGSSGLMLSHDMGLTWEYDSLNGIPVDTSFPGMSEHLAIPGSIVEVNGLWIASCGFSGVYVSTTRGHNWAPYYSGLIPFIARGIAVKNEVVYAGSYYSGVWKKGGPLGNMSGLVYSDQNRNGIKDNGEAVLKNQLLRTIPGNKMATTDNAGRYTLLTDAVGDTLRPVLTTILTSCLPGYYLTVNNAANKDFGIYMEPNIADLAVDITNINVFRPGFQTNITVTGRNNGSLAQAATIQVTLDNALQFLSATPAPTSVSGNVYTFATAVLQFSESQSVLIKVQTPVSMALNADVVCSAFISPVVSDTTPNDNSATLTVATVGSYDPNDKACAQGEFVTPEQLQDGEEITFTIRFQNTGNYLADFVRIADTLSQFFDLSTFRILGQSHTMHWAMTERGIVNFYFDSILLPPSSQDEPGSHGFVKYAIRCKPHTKLGNALINTAYIYFDFNPAIITNTTTTLVAYPFNTAGPTGILVYNNEKVNVYPNPASDMLMVDTKDLSGSGQQVAIFDLSGRIVYQQAIVKGLTTIDVSVLNAGMFMGRLSNEQGKTIGNFKFVVSR